MLAIVVFFIAIAVLIAVVATESARSPGLDTAVWRIAAFLIAAAGLALFAFGVVILAMMIVSTPRGPEGRFPAFLAATLCSVIGGVLFGVVVLPSRGVFGRRAVLLARTALCVALVVAALFVWQQISWRLR